MENMEVIGQQLAFRLTTPVGDFSVMINPIMHPNSLEVIDRLMVNATSDTALSGDWLCRVYGVVHANMFGGAAQGLYEREVISKFTFDKVAKKDDKEIQVWKPAIDKRTGKERKNAASAELTEHIETCFWDAFHQVFLSRTTTHQMHSMLLRVEADRRLRRAKALLDIVDELEALA